MIFRETTLPGVLLVEPEVHRDERGGFARTYCVREFAEHGLVTTWVQNSWSENTRRGTLRGMHWQCAPSEETKLVRCTRGSIYDVLVDVREGSPTRGRFQAFTLTAENHHALYVPPGIAHGFQTLEDACEVLYQISAFYAPEAARGVRWNDPALGIEWPLPPAVVSARDAVYPDFVR